MKIDETIIEDTYAEAFDMRFTRLVVTAMSQRWLEAAVNEFTGYGTSVIGCDAEAGLEAWLPPEQTFDQRPGAAMLAFGLSLDGLAKAVGKRAGQCLMTCPTTAVFDGYVPQAEASQEPKKTAAPKDTAKHTAKPISLGNHLKFFGDGFQKSKLLGKRRFWRIPVMDGEFICEETAGVGKGVAGGNFLIQSVNQKTGLCAAERAVDAIAKLPGVITPFPGGVVRSGSKVGSKYESLVASTSHQFCPTLKGRVDSLVHTDANCVYEIVIDGIDFSHVADAMRIGIHAAVGEGILVIGAGNYGGNLGKHHFRLHDVLSNDGETDEGE